MLKALSLMEEQQRQRFPFGPLENALRAESRADAAGILDVSVDLIKRFERVGLTVDEADRLACKINMHPMFIWDNWMDIQPIDDFLLDLVEEYLKGKKKCAECAAWKPYDMYFKRANSRDGLAHKCKKCALVYESERKARQRDAN